MTDDFGLFDDDFDDDEFFRAWEEVDRSAARVLFSLCGPLLVDGPPAALTRAAEQLRAGVVDQRWPFEHVAAGCGWGDELPDNDIDLWLQALAASISPVEDPGTDVEEQSAVAALQHADWLGIAAAAVRRGVGSTLDAEAVLAEVDALDDVEGESEDPEDDARAIDFALTVLSPLWQGLGVLDEDDRWTELGRWGVPRALHHLWLGKRDELSEAEAALAIGLLVDRPLGLETLRRELAKQSVFADEGRIEKSLQWRPEVYTFDDGEFGHLPSLVEGIVLTHRVTEEELELGVLVDDADLGLFGFVGDEGIPIVGGGDLKHHYRPRGEPVPEGEAFGLGGPEGWLSALAPGDLVALRYVGGAVEVTRADETSSEDARTVTALARQRAEEAAAGEGVDDFPGANVLDIVMSLRRQNPRALSLAHRPMVELLTDAGLEVDGREVGLPGTAWYGEPEWLTDEQRATYRRWRQALGTAAREELTTGELADLARSLTGIVLDLAAQDMVATPGAAQLVTAMAEALSGSLLAVPHYLLSRRAEDRADGKAWLEHLETAVDADPSCSEALGDLADLRSVAGDAREALRLYEAAGVDPSRDEVQVLRPMLQVPEGEVGRNKPCHCGSGKKYKVCHGRTAQHPLSARVDWLWAKVATYLQRGANREALLSWAALRTGQPEDSREAVAFAMGDPVTSDFALWDGELLLDFLETLGPLLPADEVELARSWTETPRRLMEVVRVVTMHGVTARDLLTDETIEIRDRAITTAVRPKDLLYGRPLSDAAGNLRFRTDPLSIPRMMRGPLLRLLRAEAPGESILQLFAPRGLPELRTTQGQELVLCAARYDVPDVEKVWAALAEQLTQTDSADELVVEGDDSLVLGRFLRADDRLTVETMSLERLRALQGRLLDIAPAARLVDESSRPFADLLAESPELGSDGTAELPPEVLEQVIRGQEDRWLDDSIPALGGLTPREAAADPAMRSELEALLDDFEWTARDQPPGALAMDVARLRRELGIGQG